MRRTLMLIAASLSIVVAAATSSSPASAENGQVTICSYEYGDGRIEYKICIA